MIAFACALSSCSFVRHLVFLSVRLRVESQLLRADYFVLHQRIYYIRLDLAHFILGRVKACQVQIAKASSELDTINVRQMST